MAARDDQGMAESMLKAAAGWPEPVLDNAARTRKGGFLLYPVGKYSAVKVQTVAELADNITTGDRQLTVAPLPLDIPTDPGARRAATKAAGCE